MSLCVCVSACARGCRTPRDDGNVYVVEGIIYVHG